MSGLRSLLPPALRAGRRIGDRLQVLHFRAGPPGSSFPNNIGVRTVAGAAPCALVGAELPARLGMDDRARRDPAPDVVHLDRVGVLDREIGIPLGERSDRHRSGIGLPQFLGQRAMKSRRLHSNRIPGGQPRTKQVPTSGNESSAQEMLNGVDGDRIDQHGVVVGVEIHHGGVAVVGDEAL